MITTVVVWQTHSATSHTGGRFVWGETRSDRAWPTLSPTLWSLRSGAYSKTMFAMEVPRCASPQSRPHGWLGTSGCSMMICVRLPCFGRDSLARRIFAQGGEEDVEKGLDKTGVVDVIQHERFISMIWSLSFDYLPIGDELDGDGAHNFRLLLVV